MGLSMDRHRLQQHFEGLDAHLGHPTRLRIRGGAAAIALGLDGRVTLDIDVLPDSTFVEPDLRQACERAGLAFNPAGKDFLECDYLELVPAGTLILPDSSGTRPDPIVFRGQRLTVTTPPPADLLVGKLKRLDPEDLEDIAFLVRRFALSAADIREAYGRLPERLRKDAVLEDNLRYVLKDFLAEDER